MLTKLNSICLESHNVVTGYQVVGLDVDAVGLLQQPLNRLLCHVFKVNVLRFYVELK